MVVVCCHHIYFKHYILIFFQSQHLFREPEKRPPAIVSNAFTLLVILPFVFFLVMVSFQNLIEKKTANTFLLNKTLTMFFRRR